MGKINNNRNHGKSRQQMGKEYKQWFKPNEPIKLDTAALQAAGRQNGKNNNLEGLAPSMIRSNQAVCPIHKSWTDYNKATQRSHCPEQDCVFHFRGIPLTVREVLLCISINHLSELSSDRQRIDMWAGVIAEWQSKYEQSPSQWKTVGTVSQSDASGFVSQQRVNLPRTTDSLANYKLEATADQPGNYILWNGL